MKKVKFKVGDPVRISRDAWARAGHTADHASRFLEAKGVVDKITDDDTYPLIVKWDDDILAGGYCNFTLSGEIISHSNVPVLEKFYGLELNDVLKL